MNRCAISRGRLFSAAQILLLSDIRTFFESEIRLFCCCVPIIHHETINFHDRFAKTGKYDSGERICAGVTEKVSMPYV